MTFIIWGGSTVMTVSVKVAQATHDAPPAAQQARQHQCPPLSLVLGKASC
jgi:hypothetical protein